MQFKQTFLAGAAICALASCHQPAANSGQTSSRKLLDPANMDTTVNPGDNFFQYANGTWLKKNPVPASETRWGSFNDLVESNYKALHSILDSVAAIANLCAGKSRSESG